MVQLKQFDAFPKVESNYKERKGAGGLVSLLVVVVLCVLITGEVRDYFHTQMKHDFMVDPVIHETMQINFDVSVKMPCNLLSIDVLDLSKELAHVDSKIKKDAVHFTASNARHFRDVGGYRYDQNVQAIFDNADDKNANSAIQVNNEGQSPDACRLYGSFTVNKVAGNLHITALGHGHGGAHTPHEAINFTHRIDKFSFGQDYPRMHNPLDDSVEISRNTFEGYQYFLSVVPTIYADKHRAVFTNQYAVTENYRPITVMNGSPTEIPGIFFRYFIEPISVRITEVRKDLLTFLVRICGIVGGVWVTSGLAYRLMLKFQRWAGFQ